MTETHPGIQPVGTGDWIRKMLYSHPGWGKSSLIGTASEAGLRTLIIRTYMDQLPARILKLPNIDEFLANTHEQMQEILDFCRMSASFPYDWVWWDNISIDQDVLLDDIWAGTVADKPSRGFILGDDGKALRPNLSPTSGLDKGEYGRNAERIQQWVRHMVGCNRFHFGITAHPMEGPHPANDEGGDLLVPYIQVKNMPSKICGYMNMVGFLQLEEDDEENKFRRMYYKENDRFYAKDLYDAFLPDGYLDNPTIPKIMTAVEKARQKRLGKPQSTTRRGAKRTQAKRGRRAAA
jgi:hypothetical protein